jgi:transcriptional regulator with XRE-family HTH domain
VSLVSDHFLAELDDKEFRDAYVDRRARRLIAYQIRSLREERGWSQADLAQRLGTKQNAISRLENPEYGKFSVTTLLEVAAALEVAWLGVFLSHEEFLMRSGDLSPSSLAVRPYDPQSLRGSLRNSLDREAKTYSGINYREENISHLRYKSFDTLCAKPSLRNATNDIGTFRKVA